MTILLLLVGGFILLVLGAELLVRGATRLAVLMGISPLVVGLTIVALGTSSPEVAVSIQAALAGKADLSVGNVIGSNIFNILLVLGLSAIIRPLIISRQLIRLDVPIFIISSLLLLWFGWNGCLCRLEALVFLLGVTAYTMFLFIQSRRENGTIPAEVEDIIGDGSFFDHLAPKPVKPGINYVLLLILGVILLEVGSDWLVKGASSLALTLGVSDLIIGLTVIAMGTSLPELATSMVALFKGESDMAVGNAVGSSIFNIFLVLGAAALVSPQGIHISRAVLSFDLPVMIAVAFACLPIFFTGHRISRKEGVLFVSYYGAYLFYIVLNETGHQSLPLFNQVMMAFVFPITAIAVLTGAWRYLRTKKLGQ